jgi:hypothetical protein
LDEVAKSHGGDAGVGESSSKSAAPGETPAEADEEEDPNSPNAKSKGEGTGEQYVKSSGLKADGGDFDAMKPGAGREADRKWDLTHPPLSLSPAIAPANSYLQVFSTRRASTGTRAPRARMLPRKASRPTTVARRRRRASAPKSRRSCTDTKGGSIIPTRNERWWPTVHV